jgi:hypothetical protein
MCLVSCFLAIAAVDYFGIPASAVPAASLLGAALCLLGAYSDRRRNSRMRMIESELGQYRSAEYRRFKINQRSRAL